MDGLRVFLWGGAEADCALRALQALRPFQVLDGPVGSAALVGVRDGVLVELNDSDPGTLEVRFVDAHRSRRAWIAAHSFFWMVTRHPPVDEAILTGPGVAPLHFREGRIRHVQTS